MLMHAPTKIQESIIIKLAKIHTRYIQAIMEEQDRKKNKLQWK